MKKFVLVFALFLFGFTSRYGEVIDSFNGINVYDNGNGRGGYQCVEYVVRYYEKIYDIYIFDYLTPSYVRGNVYTYNAGDFFRKQHVSEDSVVSFIEYPKYLKVGDLIVYSKRDYPPYGHVAIYIGNGMEIGQNIDPPRRDVDNEYSGIIRAN